MPRWAKLGLVVAVYVDHAACPGELLNHEDFRGCGPLIFGPGIRSGLFCRGQSNDSACSASDDGVRVRSATSWASQRIASLFERSFG